MFRYRLIYAAVLAAVCVFYIAYHPWFSWFLLVLVFSLTPLDLALSLPGMFSKQVRLDVPLFLEKNGRGFLTITTVHKRAFPVRCLYVKLRVVGDDFVAGCDIQVPAGIVCRGEVPVDTEKTGLTVFEVKKVYAVSLIGLFSVRIKTKSRVAVLVLPPSERPANTLALPHSTVLQPKLGGGFSEEHDMREYLLGDPVRSIHWKLSAKLDSLIVREPLIPPQQSRLVHITPWDSFDARDSTLSHLRWVTDYLLGMGLSFFVKFGDRYLISEICCMEDLVVFLRNVLDKSAIVKPSGHPKITRFSWVYVVRE